LLLTACHDLILERLFDELRFIDRDWHLHGDDIWHPDLTGMRTAAAIGVALRRPGAGIAADGCRLLHRDGFAHCPRALSRFDLRDFDRYLTVDGFVGQAAHGVLLRRRAALGHGDGLRATDHLRLGHQA